MKCIRRWLSFTIHSISCLSRAPDFRDHLAWTNFCLSPALAAPHYPEFTVEDRRRIEKQVVKHGGTYKADLDRTCTHLIAGKGSGSKFRFAKRHDIATVTISWFSDCLKYRGRLDVKDYEVRDEEGGTETVTRSAAKPAAAQAPAPSAPNIPNTSAPPPAGPLPTPSLPTVSSRGGTSAAPMDDSIPAQLAATRLDHCPIFSSLHICISPFLGQTLRTQLRRIVRDLGGMTSDAVDAANVTHYLVDSFSPAEEKALRNLKRLPVVVDWRWLRGCLEAKQGVEAGNWVLPIPHSLRGIPCATIVVPPASRVGGMVGNEDAEPVVAAPVVTAPSGSVTAAPEARKIRPKRASEVMEEMFADIMADGLPPTAAPAASKPPIALVSAATKRKAPEEDERAGPVVPQGTLFTGLSMVLQGFNQAQTSSIRAAVEAQGGRCVAQPSERGGHCYLVTPMNAQPTTVSGATRATGYWLQACIDDNTLYPPSSHPLFQPSRYPLPIPLFSGLVITLTGFHGNDRDIVVRLISELGATYSESFGKTITHLLADVRGEPSNKIAFAKKRNIPVLSTEWLFACLAEGQCVPTAEHEVFEVGGPNDDKKENVSSSGRAFTFRRPGDNSTVDVPSRPVVGLWTTRYLDSDPETTSNGGANLVHPRFRKVKLEAPALSDGFGAMVDELISGSKPGRSKRARGMAGLGRETAPPPPPAMPGPEEDSQKSARALPLLFGNQNSQERDGEGSVTYDDPDGRKEKRKLLDKVAKKSRTPKMESRVKAIEILSDEEEEKREHGGRKSGSSSARSKK